MSRVIGKGDGYILYYREYNEDAFNHILSGEDKDVKLITYTSAAAIHTVFENVRKRLPLLEKLKLIIGFDIPVNNCLKFESSIAKVRDEMGNSFWSGIGIELYFHNYCHVKFIQTENVCLTGSQNFSGLSYARAPKSQFYKNEVLISLQSNFMPREQTAKLLFDSLLKNKDEFISISQDDLQYLCARTIFNEMDNNRKLNILRNAKERAREIDLQKIKFDAEQNAESFHDEDYSLSDAVFSNESIYVPPAIFLLHNRIHVLMYSLEDYPSRDIEEVNEDFWNIIQDFEQCIGCTDITDRLNYLLNFSGDIKIFDLRASKSLHRIDEHILNCVGDYLIRHERTLSARIVRYQLNVLLRSVTIEISEELERHSLNDNHDFMEVYQQEMVNNIFENPECYIDNFSDKSPDQLNDACWHIVREQLCPRDMFKYIPDAEERLMDELRGFSEKLSSSIFMFGFKDDYI